jgi:hypothetical protein
MTDLIKLKISGNKITSDKLILSIRYFYNFVNEVAFKVFNAKNPIKWIVDVEKNSIDLLSIAEFVKKSDINKSNTYFESLQNGIDILKNGVSKYPENYTDDALESLKNLVSQIDSRNGVSEIAITINSKINTLIPKIIDNVELLLNIYPNSMSSITGRLSTLTERNGLKVVVYDDRTGKAVDCDISQYPEFLKDAFDAFTKRVYIYGLMSYYTNGRPKRIRVKRITKFKDESELTPILKTSGILKGA